MSEVLVAPFSNSDIRDWPLDHYAALVGLLLARLPVEARVLVVGVASQRLRACEVVRSYPADRVENLCGRIPWTGLVERLKTAACVISNNSGLGHLGGRFGVPTVCVFGGSHPRHEWRPLGRTVILVSRAIGCSPCQLDHATGSPYRKACLREIAPERVADAAFLIMRRVAEGAGGGPPRDGGPTWQGGTA